MVAPALARHGSIRVAAVANRTTKAAEEVAAAVGGADICSDFRELLSRRDVRAVYIATPPYLHREMVIAAIEAGKHVVCEKPFVMNTDELAEVSNVHRRRPEIKVASCSSRFLACPAVKKARGMLTARKIGRILNVRFSAAMPAPLPISYLPAWKRSRETSGGGLLMDWGVYDLDWLRYLLGAAYEPVAVFGGIDCWGYETEGLETGFSVEILCRSGLIITWERRAEQGPQFQRSEVRGTDGGLDLPFMPGDGKEALTHYWWDRDKNLRTDLMSESTGGWDSILAYPIFDMADAIFRDRPVASPLSTQREIYSVIEAVYRSSSSGKSIEIGL